MKKRRIIFIVLIIIALIIAVLSVALHKAPPKYLKSFDDFNPDNIKLIPSKKHLSTDDVLYNLMSPATCGVVAEYIDFDNEYYCWRFKNIEVIFGEAPEDEIWINYTDLHMEMTPNSSFKQGEKYLLLLSREDTVLYYPSCLYRSAFVYLPLDDLSECRTACGKITFENNADASDLVTYVAKLAETRGYDCFGLYRSHNILRNESLKTVVEKSDCLFKIKVNSQYASFPLKAYDIYKCEVTEALRGEYETTDSGEIKFITIPDSLEIGKEYIVSACLYHDSDYSKKDFNLSANNGIIPLDDEALVEEFYKYYNK